MYKYVLFSVKRKLCSGLEKARGLPALLRLIFKLISIPFLLTVFFMEKENNISYLFVFFIRVHSSVCYLYDVETFQQFLILIKYYYLIYVHTSSSG
jgi:hypothetical protein